LIIDFAVISHRRQRYPTVGDYFWRDHRWHIRVSRMKDRRYITLVFLHEIIEWTLCRLAKIPMLDIDHWDLIYERNRPKEDDPEWAGKAPCGCKFFEEPGDDPHAPYHKQHVTATNCERLIAEALGVKWEKYEKAVESAGASQGEK
jgi:hypothetical protein